MTMAGNLKYVFFIIFIIPNCNFTEVLLISGQISNNSELIGANGSTSQYLIEAESVHIFVSLDLSV